MKRPNIFLILSGLAILLTGCKGEGLHKEFSYGEFSNHKYINEFFKISLDIPEKWSIASKEDREEVFGNIDNSPSLNEKQKEVIEKTKHRNAYLFLAHVYDPNTFELYVNPSFFINVERIDDNKFVRNAEDYMKLSRKTSRKLSSEQVDFVEPARVKLAGNVFERHTIKYKVDYLEYEITQFCEIINGYAVVYNLLYSNDEDRKELVKCLSTLKHGK